MVNYKRVVCEVAVLLVVLSVTTAAPAADCTHAHYDQRQNGTENYRLNIDGVVIAVAPAESLLEAASDLSDYFDMTSIDVLLKPSSESPSTKPQESLKPDAEKPLSDVSLNSDLPAQKKDASVRKQEKAQRLKHRLANAIIPLLRRTRHQ
ncbi:uncharacterized protein LOC125064831 [Vanessa atalanta]|uniref:uncharacterized protein LOC125064831 n=1 Tax=Vanessa atalanta TaxID=42275 RepID=UPI001FCDD54F|nr:uncharacterized protein LOC125064831 [Vanessa atalanta]